MSVHFREALQADYADICRLVPNAQELYWVYPRGTYPFTVDQITYLAATRKELTVASYGEETIGFANLYDFKDKEKAFIGNVIVKKSARGRGVGRLLMGYMLSIAFSKYDLSAIHISVFSDNIPALLLYTKIGFQAYAIEERRNYASKRVALVHMKLGKGIYKIH